MSALRIAIASALLLLSPVLEAGAQPGKKEAPAAAAPKPAVRPAPAAVIRPAPAARPALVPHIAAPARPAARPQISTPHAAPRYSAAPHIQRSIPQRSVSGVAQPSAERMTRHEIRVQRQERLQGRARENLQARTTPQADRPAALAASRQAESRQTVAQDRQHIRDLLAKQRRELRQIHSPAERRLLLSQQREQLRALRSQQQADRLAVQNKNLQSQNAQSQNAQNPQVQGLRRDGQPRISAQAAQQGRFAARFQNDPGRARWRTAAVAAPQAWRSGWRAAFVPWFGPVYFPYAYWDVFAYAFWPFGYDPGYWAFAYDDFFDGVYFPYGPPYAVYADEGPYAVETTGAAPEAPYRSHGRYRTASAPVPGRVSAAAQELCREPDKGITAWPIDRIEQAVQPNDEQKRLLADLKDAAARAAEGFRASCVSNAAMTPPGRLQAMVSRLQAAYDAVRLVRPTLEAFYNALSDEQKARFNALGPNLGQERTAQGDAQSQQANTCGEAKPGLTNLPIERIEDSVRPVGAQQDALNKLGDATAKAVATLQATCPDVVALTPVGRLAQMEKRLDAMLQAAKTLQPALEDFYASLSNEQKARFNALGKETARGG